MVPDAIYTAIQSNRYRQAQKELRRLEQTDKVLFLQAACHLGDRNFREARLAVKRIQRPTQAMMPYINKLMGFC